MEICNAGSRAAALTQKLLAFSRQQIVEARPVELNALVQKLDRCSAPLRRGHRARHEALAKPLEAL